MLIWDFRITIFPPLLPLTQWKDGDILHTLCSTWNSGEQRTDRTTPPCVSDDPASVLAREAFRFSPDAGTTGPAASGVWSISVYAARTSKSSLVQNDRRTAGEMLPRVGNGTVLPLVFPYKSEDAHLGAPLVPNYLCATSFCSRKINSLSYA